MSFQNFNELVLVFDSTIILTIEKKIKKKKRRDSY